MGHPFNGYLQLGLNSRRLTTIALWIAIVPLLGWWITGLFDLDEGFYAAVVGGMNRRGEWVTPFYNGQPWFEKPILLYWMAKPCLAIFGDMIGPRLPSVLSAIGCYVLVARYARRWLSENAATYSVIVLSSSLLFVAIGRMMMTDMPLVLTFSAAMLTFWESLTGNRKMRLATAALLGLAVLAKGPVALILFVLIAGWTFWKEPELRPAFRGQWLLGTVILVGVIALWYVPAYLANGQLFVQKFLIEQNVGRFTGGDKAHTIKAAWAYPIYIPILLLGMTPWLYYLVRNGRWSQIADSQSHNASSQFLRYLSAWTLVVLLFFSISSAKLPHYVLPACVPLAMLVPAAIDRWIVWTKRTNLWVIAFASTTILVGVMLIGSVNKTSQLLGIAALISSIVLWGLLQANALAKATTENRVKWSLIWTVSVGLLANVGFLAWYEKSGQREAHELARYVRENSVFGVPETVAVYQLPRRSKDLGTGKPKLQETSLPSMLLYLNTTVTEAETPDEVINAKCHWLFTRSGRMTEPTQEAFVNAGLTLRRVGPATENFELYELKPASEQ